jgi:trigger factor
VLAIEVPAEDVEREYERVARKVAKTVRLKGFRKGKVPVDVIRKSFKSELDQEFLESVVPKAFQRALEDTGLDPITQPRFEEVSFGEERPLSFTADFECRPQLEVTGTTGIPIEKQIPEVTDEHVDRVLENFRQGRATLEDVTRPAIAGDVLLLDYQAVDDAGKPIPNRQVKGYSIELGTGQVVEAFESALAGVEPEAVRMAEVPYPEDYQDPLLAGRTAHYKIKVRKVQEKRFPALSDELVKEHTDLETLDALRERVRTELMSQADRTAVERIESLLLEKVVDANPFDPPQQLVDDLLEDFVAQTRYEAQERGDDPNVVDGDELKSENRDAAARQVRRMLLLDSIAREQKIATEPDELRERVSSMARMRGVSPKKLVEALGGDRFLRRLSRELRDKKVLAFLVQNAEITEKTVAVQESAASGS